MDTIVYGTDNTQYRTIPAHRASYSLKSQLIWSTYMVHRTIFVFDNCANLAEVYKPKRRPQYRPPECGFPSKFTLPARACERVAFSRIYNYHSINLFKAYIQA